MIEKIICENNTENNYEYLSEERKLKYQNIYKKSTCCPERYILSIDISSPYSKDYSCAITYNYEEYLKGNVVIENVEYF